MVTSATSRALRELSSDALIAALEPLVTRDAIVAFDADGTLWSGDIGMETFQRVLREGLLRDAALSAMVQEADAFGVPRAAESNEQGRHLYRAFEKGAYPQDRAFAMMAWSLAGHTVADVRAIADREIAAGGLAGRGLPEAVAMLHWAHGRGVPVYIVSASPGLVVERAVAHLGLPVTGVFGMRAQLDGDVLLPALSGRPTYGEGKALVLRENVGGTQLIAAFGDSAFDLAMLRSARLPVAIRPKQELVLRHEECPDMVKLRIQPSAPPADGGAT